MTAPPPILPRPPKTWLGRNWKWFVPLLACGCLLLFALFAGGITWGVFRMIKSSEPYQLALQRVQADPRAVELLGEPVQDGWYVTGQYNAGSSSGFASLAIPVHGPKGRATVFALAYKRMGAWEFDRLELEPQKSETRLNLLSPADKRGHGSTL